MTDRPWRVAGLHFDHMHMGDLLREAADHPRAEIAGICHREPEAMREAIANFNIPGDRVYTDVGACLRETRADVALLCPSTADHARAVEDVAPHRVHVLIEKPFAASLADADRMTAAMADAGKELMINWPLRWYPPHITTHRLITEGRIGDVLEVHYYDGNRGPLRHGADKIEKEPGEKSKSWWYHRDKGGGSLLDYLGYGVTLGTWFHGGKAPIEVTATIDKAPGLEVDEHSITVARYDVGLSKYETRWGTFSDPWTHQPQPKCGFVVVGSAGTISSYDFESTVRLQTPDSPMGHDIPVDEIPPPYRGPIEYFLHGLETGRSPEGPLSPAMGRVGQQIVDTAFASAREKRTLPLIDTV